MEGKKKNAGRHSSMQTYVPFSDYLEKYPNASLGPNGHTFSFINQDKAGLTLAGYKWAHTDPSTTRGVIYFFHSYTKHTLADYFVRNGEGDSSDLEALKKWQPQLRDSWIDKFFSAGFDVWALDHQSHGRSEGWNEWRCNVSNFGLLIRDALDLIDRSRSEMGDRVLKLPFYILGYSMGGNIALQVAQQISSNKQYTGIRDQMSGVVLLAPMIEIVDRAVTYLILCGLGCISYNRPNSRMMGGETSHSPEYLSHWDEDDPYVYTGANKTSMADQLVRATLTVQKNMKKLKHKLPILCLQGTEDKSVKVHGPEHLKKSQATITLEYLDGRSHYFVQELGNQPIGDRLVQWVEEIQRLREASVPATDE